MKKGVILLSILVLALTIPLVLAEDDSVNKSYSCLDGKVRGKCSALNLEDATFSLLALSYDSSIQAECKSAVMSKSRNNECWPNSACKLRDTAIATVALQYISQDSGKPEAWLANQSKTPSEITWFLEIDSKDASTCKIYLDNSSVFSNTITHAADKTLTLSGSSVCLSLANSNYWLQISSSCVNKVFKVSCDKDFSTALLYKKTQGSSSDVWHISSQTKASSSGGSTENQPIALCLKQNNACDYEGTLWGVLALQKNYEISSYLPYLIALAPENEKFNPEAFLYILTGSDDNLANLRANQNPAGFFNLGSSYGRNYDTALSLRAIRDLADDSSLIKEWLLSVRGNNGCWQDSIRDTAFILYSGWPKTPLFSGGGGGAIRLDYCEDANKYCSSRTECLDSSGQILDNFVCRADSLKSCCSVQPIQQTCAQKLGIACKSNEECFGNLVSSSDSSRCCLEGSCEKIVTPGCESSGYYCKSACSSSEEAKSGSGLDCPSNKICCGAVSTQPTSYWWIWVLIILILLVVLAIVFRNRLRVFIFKSKNKGSSSPVSPTRPAFPPASQFPRPMMRPVMPSRTIPQKLKSKTDDELEQTLRKLREMSK